MSTKLTQEEKQALAKMESYDEMLYDLIPDSYIERYADNALDMLPAAYSCLTGYVDICEDNFLEMSLIDKVRYVLGMNNLASIDMVIEALNSLRGKEWKTKL